MPKPLHPAVAAMLPFFAHAHLPPDLAEVSEPFGELAKAIADGLEGPEATVCVRKLLEAKDCAVRARLAARNRDAEPDNA